MMRRIIRKIRVHRHRDILSSDCKHTSDLPLVILGREPEL